MPSFALPPSRFSPLPHLPQVHHKGIDEYNDSMGAPLTYHYFRSHLVGSCDTAAQLDSMLERTIVFLSQAYTVPVSHSTRLLAATSRQPGTHAKR